jgi:hypothetical protein
MGHGPTSHPTAVSKSNESSGFVETENQKMLTGEDHLIFLEWKTLIVEAFAF